ncbi:conjugative transposon protein TraM [Epilithonimonas ginsengisoli]|uniref:Conjugative transposon protein TraM n=1 Tax=Epilithonimonas ginsengisoli TaxID=1245592 RepID=A0ABU4JJZ0_9FLAO|nr:MULTISPECIES: conjugative transposon protein TraM [Chryseobacterium group]MBV6880482.1 conjugative transposon protein TraM [Epilithonimonas sp. FP105]MDW8549998.1 conjugative transposon protein TraM [Epilithonimonas ginsengisoli]OAH69184.1 conjugal transfer protein TraM [Chryseobacterium sp. FP211-J200]
MKDSDKIKITESDTPLLEQESRGHQNLQWERIKRPLIYFLMAAVCAGCFYLIFKPKDDKIAEESGFNAGIPQAKDDQMQSDKQKAYEQQLLEQKNEEKKNAMTSLSDYWNDSSNTAQSSDQALLKKNSDGLSQSNQSAVNSYRNAQQTLGSFYSRDEQEVINLRKEISRLKNEASQNNAAPAGLAVNDQLELMEKSYQMAAKYLPQTTKQEQPPSKEEDVKQSTGNKLLLTAVQPAQLNVVSSLYREPSDSAFLAGLNDNRLFGTQNHDTNTGYSKNAIKGIVQETKTMTTESTLSIRLSEGMRVGRTEIPSGTLLKATCKFQNGRLQLVISSIEYKGSIYPVEINVYDNDGQLGLSIPSSQEQNAVTDIVGSMGQTSGTNIMMTQSAGQQIAADMSRGLVQGLSNYFQKRVRQLKVTVKAGHEVFLVPKK